MGKNKKLVVGKKYLLTIANLKLVPVDNTIEFVMPNGALAMSNTRWTKGLQSLTKFTIQVAGAKIDEGFLTYYWTELADCFQNCVGISPKYFIYLGH